MDGGSAAGSSPCCTGTEGGAPTRLAEMMQHNEQFIARDFHKLPAFPRRVVIVTCMDPRLNTLLPKALGLKEGEAYVVKNAGAIITHPFGGITRSVFVAVYELGAKEIFIIGHRDCGMTKVAKGTIIPKMVNSFGITRQALLTLHYSGTDVENWMSGFESVEDGVKYSVDIIRNHPLCPLSIPVHGLVIDPHTGKIDVIVDGYKDLPVLNGGVPHGHADWLSSMVTPPAPSSPKQQQQQQQQLGSPAFTLQDSLRHEQLEQNIGRAARRAHSNSHGGDSLELGEGGEAELEAAREGSSSSSSSSSSGVVGGGGLRQGAAAKPGSGSSSRGSSSSSSPALAGLKGGEEGEELDKLGSLGGGGPASSKAAPSAATQAFLSGLPALPSGAKHTMSIGRSHTSGTKTALRDIFGGGKMGIN